MARPDYPTPPDSNGGFSDLAGDHCRKETTNDGESALRGVNRISNSEDIWNATTKLASVHRPATIAHALGLDYNVLKDRIASANPSICRREPTEPAFVELISPTPTCFSECTLEIEDRRGT